MIVSTNTRFLALALSLVLTCLLGASIVSAQTVHRDFTPVDGLLRIGPEPERQIHLVDKGQTFILPQQPPVRGVIVFLDRMPLDPAPWLADSTSLEAMALENGLAVLRMTTGNPLDFFFSDSVVHDVASRIETVLASYHLGDIPLFHVGLSLAGTRSLKLTEYLVKHDDEFRLHTGAVAVVDAPLDMIRFWHAEQRAADIAYHPAAADEGRWVTYLLETNLGGTPESARERYIEYSPYTYGELGGGNARYLKDIPVRAYHEPDVNWWIDNRRKDYNSMNSIDLAALINDLKLMGNERAELITTHNQRSGYDDGSSPHTWSIVDQQELIRWFVEQLP
ncbi:MAG: hypothetical protein GF341_07560 [candidate division Zixibacteria bacterium]|nr:hypothetical protein [candidate division Zixibacteria bacterium]